MKPWQMDLLFFFVFASLLIVLTVPRCADAQESDYAIRYTLTKVPTTFDENKMPQKCLNTQQWKTVMLMSSDYRGLYDWRLKTLGTLAAHDKLVGSYELMLKTKDMRIDELKRDRKYLTMRLDQSYQFGQSQVKSRKIERIMMWAVIVVQSGVILVGGVKGIAQ